MQGVMRLWTDESPSGYMLFGFTRNSLTEGAQSSANLGWCGAASGAAGYRAEPGRAGEKWRASQIKAALTAGRDQLLWGFLGCCGCRQQHCVFYASEVLAHGFHPSSWESRADGDLWSLIAAEMVSRPKDSIRFLKVKAHSSLEDAVDSFHQWLMAGNAAADRLAKATLTTYLKENKMESRALHDTTKIDDAFVCSRLLHQISLHVRDTIKQAPAMDTHQDTLDSRPVENLPSEDVQPWQLDKVAHFNSPTWDENWLQLVQHYFSL